VTRYTYKIAILGPDTQRAAVLVMANDVKAATRVARALAAACWSCPLYYTSGRLVARDVNPPGVDDLYPVARMVAG